MQNTELILPDSYKNDERKRRNVEHILEAMLRAIPKIGKNRQAIFEPLVLKTMANPLGEQCVLSLSELTTYGIYVEIHGANERWIADRKVKINSVGKGNKQKFFIESSVNTATEEQGTGIGGGLMAITKPLYARIVECLQLKENQVVWLIKDEAKGAKQKTSIAIDADRHRWSSEWARLLGFHQVTEDNAFEKLGESAKAYDFSQKIENPDIVWVRGNSRG